MLRSPFSTWKSFTLSLFLVLAAGAILGGSIFITSAHKKTAANSAQSKRAAAPELKGFDITKPQPNCCGAKALGTEFTAMNAPDYQGYKLTATYFQLRDGLTTTLMFNNKGAQAIVATPTIYSMSGSIFHAAPITVPAASYIDVDMHQVLAGAGSEFYEGSVKVGYTGMQAQLGCQVKMIDPAHSLI